MHSQQIIKQLLMVFIYSAELLLSHQITFSCHNVCRKNCITSGCVNYCQPSTLIVWLFLTINPSSEFKKIKKKSLRLRLEDNVNITQHRL